MYYTDIARANRKRVAVGAAYRITEMTTKLYDGQRGYTCILCWRLRNFFFFIETFRTFSLFFFLLNKFMMCILHQEANIFYSIFLRLMVKLFFFPLYRYETKLSWKISNVYFDPYLHRERERLRGVLYSSRVSRLSKIMSHDSSCCLGFYISRPLHLFLLLLLLLFSYSINMNPLLENTKWKVLGRRNKNSKVRK